MRKLELEGVCIYLEVKGVRRGGGTGLCAWGGAAARARAVGGVGSHVTGPLARQRDSGRASLGG